MSVITSDVLKKEGYVDVQVFGHPVIMVSGIVMKATILEVESIDELKADMDPQYPVLMMDVLNEPPAWPADVMRIRVFRP